MDAPPVSRLGKLSADGYGWLQDAAQYVVETYREEITFAAPPPSLLEIEEQQRKERELEKEKQKRKKP